jgi:CheY-like chemotaxis protein
MSSPEGPHGSGNGRGDAARLAFREGFGAPADGGPKALVVDDDYRSALALTTLLERVNLPVVAATSAYTALDALAEREDIGIVLMDIMMPVMDGYEAIAAIRRRSRLAGLPLIAVTAKDGAGERARCIAAGASDYIAKPIDPPELLSAIGKWLPDIGRGWEQLGAGVRAAAADGSAATYGSATLGSVKTANGAAAD